jgi:hypothetical protein
MNKSEKEMEDLTGVGIPPEYYKETLAVEPCIDVWALGMYAAVNILGVERGILDLKWEKYDSQNSSLDSKKKQFIKIIKQMTGKPDKPQTRISLDKAISKLEKLIED